MGLQDHPEAQSLVTKFCNDFYDLVQKAVLLEIAQRLNGKMNAPKERPRPVRALKISVKPPKISTPKAKKEYLPPVSQTIIDAVLLRLQSGMSGTSKDLAKDTMFGETSVRCALKHLIKEGVAKSHPEGRLIVYYI